MLYWIVALGCGDRLHCDSGLRWIQLSVGDIGSPEGVNALSVSPKFSPLLFSLDQFIPIIDFGYSQNWTPDTSWKIDLTKTRYLPAGEFLKWLVFIERIFGSFLSAYAIVGLTGLVRRED